VLFTNYKYEWVIISRERERESKHKKKKGLAAGLNISCVQQWLIIPTKAAFVSLLSLSGKTQI